MFSRPVLQPLLEKPVVFIARGGVETLRKVVIDKHGIRPSEKLLTNCRSVMNPRSRVSLDGGWTGNSRTTVANAIEPLRGQAEDTAANYPGYRNDTAGRRGIFDETFSGPIQQEGRRSTERVGRDLVAGINRPTRSAALSPADNALCEKDRPPVEIVVGDCLEELRKLPAESAQLVVTSPPYNIGKPYDDHLTIAELTSNQAAVIVEATRVTSDKGSLCWQLGNFVHAGEIIPLDSIVIPLMRQAGLKVRGRIVWTFGHGLHCKRRLSGRHETLVWATKGDDYVSNLDPIRVPQKYPEKKHYK